ncbi:MAG TPA: DUF2752 domain-containing protein [Cytophagaceae bacterium]|jgi:hypothetical protein|nr:DUF2752 domain-containing protein [Cytophagaceae bacterium]
MAERLNKWQKLLFHYAVSNLLFVLTGGYFLLSLLLLSFCNLDIGIPCLFRLATGLSCPGCGLTHAFAHLLKLEFAEAWAHNKLSFIVFPAGVYYLIKDFISFRKSCDS